MWPKIKGQLRKVLARVVGPMRTRLGRVVRSLDLEPPRVNPRAFTLLCRASGALARAEVSQPPAGIIFSMDRAIQLEALLGSVRDKARNCGPLTVIYRATRPDHKRAYDQVLKAYADLVIPKQQETRGEFAPILLNTLVELQSECIFFLVDDNLFIERVDLSELSEAATAYCIPSLRLGENLTRSYVVQQQQPRPPLRPFDALARPSREEDGLLQWVWSEGVLDWTYPLSLDGHMFRRSEFLALAQSVEFSSPNLLESALQDFNAFFAWRLGLCYRKSRLLNIPYNRVQTDWHNLAGEVHQDDLLEKWNEGFRIDRQAYYGARNTSAHQEMPLKIVRR